MNERQLSALEWLRRSDRERTIYEGAARDGKTGSGHYYIDRSDGRGPVLTRDDVAELVKLGHIVRRWRDCEAYMLARSKP